MQETAAWAYRVLPQCRDVPPAFASQLMTPEPERALGAHDKSPYNSTEKAWVQALCAECGDEYGLACEHAHSCCILLARKSRFHRDGAWHTWIDYERFQVEHAVRLP